jgi:CheY-like chemotaxis protein
MMAPHILAVDDDLDILAVLHDALGAEGYRVTSATTPQTALDALTGERPDLLLLDLWMGDRDAGWRLLERLRADPATAALPVIVSSADARALREQGDALRAYRCTVLEKPFDLDALLETVARTLPAGTQGAGDSPGG